MAGIAGQPSPRPNDVASPVPNSAPQDAFAMGPEAHAAGQAAANIQPPDAFAAGPQATAAPPASQSPFPGAGFVQGAINDLPAIGMGIGAAAASLAGPEAIPAGGYLGAMGGDSLKTFLNSVVFGKQPASRAEFYNQLASAGEKGSLEAAGGASVFGAPAAESFAASGLRAAGGEASPTVGGLAKSAATVATKAALEATERLTGVPSDVAEHYFAAPQPVKDLAVAAGGDVPTAANMQRQGMNQVVQQTRDQLEAPAKQLIASRVTSATPVEAGNAVKQAISDHLGMQNADFKTGYAATDAVNAALPLDINARLKFGKSIIQSTGKSDFGHIPEYAKAANDYAGLFGASETGAGFQHSVDRLNSDITAAYNSGDVPKAKFLTNIKERADDFLTKQTNNLASAVQNKTATPEQLQGFKAMADSQGIPNWKKYADDITQGHLNFVSKLDSDYGPFKDLQMDIGGQTRASGRGAVSLIKDINSRPPEKLMDILLDPKNSEPLARMQQRTPQIAQVINDYRVTKLVQGSTTDGVLDLPKFVSNVMDPKKLPPDIRALTFQPQELQTLNSTVNNAKYQRFNQLVDATKPILTDLKSPNALIKAGQSGTNEARNLGELSLITGNNMVGGAQNLAAMQHFERNGLRLTTQMVKKGMDVTRPITQFGEAMQKVAPRAGTGQ